MKIFIEKDDNENQVKLAQALLDNGLITAIEKSTYSCQDVKKSDDEVAQAVISVVGLFGVSTQWTAVYRVLVDFCGWETNVSAFCRRMDRLLKGVKLPYSCNYQSIQKSLSNYGILQMHYKRWTDHKASSDDHAFRRQLFIAQKLLEFLLIKP